MLFRSVTPRNILSKKYTFEALKQAIIPKTAWIPYPKTAAEWQAALPDSVIKSIIQNGEKALNYEFLPISASISLDFVRSGDRLRHSHISFNKRGNLAELVVAESIEDKGRFTEAILNGVWSICEESYWGVPAHIGGTGLPDVENPIVDLFAAETASVLSMIILFWIHLQ